MMYVVVGHDKLDLTLLPYITFTDGTGKPPGRFILSFNEARKRRRVLARKSPSRVLTIYELTYCDQNKEV